MDHESNQGEKVGKERGKSENLGEAGARNRKNKHIKGFLIQKYRPTGCRTRRTGESGREGVGEMT